MNIKLNEIKIKKCFLDSKPRNEKLKKHFQHYISNNEFMKPIILDKDNILVDGYITYIVAKTFNYEEIEVTIIPEVLEAIDIIIKGINNMCKTLGEVFIRIGESLTRKEDK